MKLRMFLLSVFMIFILSGCGYSEDWDDCSKLKRISVSTTAENPENICIVSYPHNYMSNGAWESMEQTAVPVWELSDEDGQYIWDYIVNLETPDYMQDYELFMDDYKEMYEGHNFTCAMAITYENIWGEEYTIYRLCFDEFPEGWTEFVSRGKYKMWKVRLMNSGILYPVLSEIIMVRQPLMTCILHIMIMYHIVG